MSELHEEIARLVQQELAKEKTKSLEEHIRQIVHEELAAWEKQQVQVRRFGVSRPPETK